MKTLYRYIILIIVLQPVLVKGQIIINEPKNNPYFLVKRIINTDTLLIDSIPSGFSYIEKVIAQQDFVYKYSNGNGFKTNFGEYFTLEKYSIENGKLKLVCISTIFTADHKKLFDSGLKIGFSEKGLCFQIPDNFYGAIILPFDYFINQKRLDYFLKFLCESIYLNKS